MSHHALGGKARVLGAPFSRRDRPWQPAQCPIVINKMSHMSATAAAWRNVQESVKIIAAHQPSLSPLIRDQAKIDTSQAAVGRWKTRREIILTKRK
jgi:hypothetical protein